MNPKALASAMKRMGIQQVDLDVEEVIFRMRDADLVFKRPAVSKINMMGQETYQLIGSAERRVRDVTPEITEEDIKTVMAQAHVDQNTASAALKKTKGDIAAAILSLT